MPNPFNGDVEPPRGAYQCKVDDKGRLKLPAAFHHCLIRLNEKVVFITTLDKRIARIYPISAWKENEKVLRETPALQKKAADVAVVANYYGADSEVDIQGRVLLPDLLRKELKLENQQIWLQQYKGRFEIYTDAAYRERVAKAMEDIESKVDELEENGLL